MPTYNWKCQSCGGEFELVRSIREHSDNPRPFFCCQVRADRYFPPAPFTALDNALSGDRHYDGLRAPDGSDISTRSKHREYMKRNGLTTADDYKGAWAKAAKEREAYRSGKGKMAVTKDDIARVIHNLER